MDEQRFDRLTRSVSRERLMMGLAGGALALLGVRSVSAGGGQDVPSGGDDNDQLIQDCVSSCNAVCNQTSVNPVVLQSEVSAEARTFVIERRGRKPRKPRKRRRRRGNRGDNGGGDITIVVPINICNPINNCPAFCQAQLG